MEKIITATDNTISFNGSRTIGLIDCHGLHGLDFVNENISLKICKFYCNGVLDCKPPIPLITFIDDPVNTPNTTVIIIDEKVSNDNLKTELIFEHVKGEFRLSYEIDLYEIKINISNMDAFIKNMECTKNHDSNKGKTWHINILDYIDETKRDELLGLNNIWLFSSDAPTIAGLYNALENKGFKGYFIGDANKYEKFKWLYVYSS